MKTMSLKKIRKSMEKALDEKRYEHTLGVEYTAAALAMRYGCSIQSARIAGLLHDCAKCLSDEKRLTICEKHNISITEVERRNPFLLHAKVGSFLAMEEYHIYDTEIINAILNHTTGRPDMNLLEKIIFIADYIEPGRKQAPRLATIRREAFVNLDTALLMVLEDTMGYLQSTENECDPMTEKTYRYYCMQQKLQEQDKRSEEEASYGA